MAKKVKAAGSCLSNGKGGHDTSYCSSATLISVHACQNTSRLDIQAACWE
jgi:hypothetical protein